MQQELCRHTQTGIQGRQPLALGSKATTRKRGQYKRTKRKSRLEWLRPQPVLSEGVKNRGMSERERERERHCRQAEWAGLFNGMESGKTRNRKYKCKLSSGLQRLLFVTVLKHLTL